MSKTNQSQADPPESPVPSKPLSIRDRVLAAAFDLLREHGFSSTSMLDIVTRARVSKRDLYALFKKKHAVLAAYLHRSPEGRRAQRDSARTRRASTTKVLHWTRTGERRILVCPTLGQKWGKEAIMKMSRRTNQEQKSIDRIECGPEKSMRHRLMKQRARLLRLREDLSKEIQQLTTQACEETPNYSMHMADAATDSFDRDLVLGLASFEQEGLYEIDAALKRIEDGTYGICELTGRPIPWERLEAIPWTHFSIEAENQLEGNIHPHIGRLGTVRTGEMELSEAAANGLADGEVDLPMDSDLLSIRTKIESQVAAGRDDRLEP